MDVNVKESVELLKIPQSGLPIRKILFLWKNIKSYDPSLPATQSQYTQNLLSLPSLIFLYYCILNSYPSSFSVLFPLFCLFYFQVFVLIWTMWSPLPLLLLLQLLKVNKVGQYKGRYASRRDETLRANQNGREWKNLRIILCVFMLLNVLHIQ